MTDDTNWPAVVEHGTCAQCGLAAGATGRDELADQLRRAAASWADLLGRTPGTLLRDRPATSPWSALEYAGHVAGVLEVFGPRVGRMLDEQDPALGWWDHEAAVEQERHQDAEPGALARRIVRSTDALVDRLGALSDEQWARVGRRRDRERFTVEGLVRFGWHEVVHHRHDATRLLSEAAARRTPTGGAAIELLRSAPVRPLDVAGFSSDTLFGQPGIYPEGPPMAPASVTELDEGRARELLEQVLGTSDGPRAVATFDDEDVRSRAPDTTVRAALALLVGGPAEPLLRAFRDGRTEVTQLGVGPTVGEGRVVGAEIGDDRPRRRVLHDRYRSEHPAAVAPSLAHALCHHGDRAGNAEEATLHGLLAAVHTWLLASDPGIGLQRSELARRQASLTISLLNARAPGSSAASIRCPDGVGTIPSGNEALQCPDLWSIPFTSRPPDRCDPDVPSPVCDSLARLAPPTAPPVPTTYDSLGGWLAQHLGDGSWFGAEVRVRAGLALGLFDLAELDRTAPGAQSS